MKRKVSKSQKIALCRKCGGTGYWHHTDSAGRKYVEVCPQCKGSGRVTVSAEMDLEIRPYKPKEQ